MAAPSCHREITLDGNVFSYLFIFDGIGNCTGLGFGVQTGVAARGVSARVGRDGVGYPVVFSKHELTCWFFLLAADKPKVYQGVRVKITVKEQLQWYRAREASSKKVKTVTPTVLFIQI